MARQGKAAININFCLLTKMYVIVVNLRSRVILVLRSVFSYSLQVGHVDGDTVMALR